MAHKANFMTRLRPVAALAAGLCWLFATAPVFAHAPAALRIASPDLTQPQPNDVTLVVRASEAGAMSETVQFRVRVDESWVDPSSGRLVDAKPAFAEFSVATGGAVRVPIRSIPAGQHSIRLQTLTDHPDLSPEVTTTISVRTSILPFALAIAAILGSAGVLAFAARKRSRREDVVGGS